MNAYLYLLIAFVAIGLLVALLLPTPADITGVESTHMPMSFEPAVEGRPGVTVWVPEAKISDYMSVHRTDVYRSSFVLDARGRGYNVTHLAV